jgi:hypothetical protein
MRRIQKIIVAVDKQSLLHSYVCARARGCVCVRARMCLWVRMRIDMCV